MPTVLLVRHGRTTANAAGILQGWTPGVHLDEWGRRQARLLGTRLACLPLVSVVTSPLERCRQTTDLLLSVPPPPCPQGQRSVPAPAVPPENTAPQGTPPQMTRPPNPLPQTDAAPPYGRVLIDDRLGECRYGDWTGRHLHDLTGDPLWPIVQAHPSGMSFPGPEGESLRDLQHRAVAAVREHDARVHNTHGSHAVWMAVTHGDVIKAILADALGLHLDGFQRLVVDPCSVSAVRYTPLRPFVLKVNDTGEDLSGISPAEETGHLPLSSDAAVGGGAGPLGRHCPPDRPPSLSDGPDAADRHTTP